MPVPSILIDEPTALALLKQWTQATVDPVITTEVEGVTGILARHKRAGLWVAATAYVIGDVVVPTLANRTGHRYICTKAGTSGATEPSWNIGEGDIQSDNTVTWREDGHDYNYVLWDLIAAAYEALDLKIMKAQDAIDFSTDGQTFHNNQLIQNLERMRARFTPVYVA